MEQGVRSKDRKRQPRSVTEETDYRLTTCIHRPGYADPDKRDRLLIHEVCHAVAGRSGDSYLELLH